MSAKRPDRNRLPRLWALQLPILAVALLTLSLALTGESSTTSSASTDPVTAKTVPDLLIKEGTVLSDVTPILTAKWPDYAVVSQPLTNAGKNTPIVEQHPSPGAELEEGELMHIYVGASTPPPKEWPTYTTLVYISALEMLAIAWLTVRLTRRKSEPNLKKG